MRSLIRVISLTLFLTVFCQPNENKKDIDIQSIKHECSKESFKDSDTAGVFVGTVCKFSELKKTSIQRYLSLCDNSGDTVIFRILLSNTDSPTENINESKLDPGMCVKVYYHTDIVKEDGVELNRFYYVTRIEYP